MEFYERDDTSKLLAEDWTNNNTTPTKTLSVSPTRRVTFITDPNEIYRAKSGFGSIIPKEEI